MTVSPKTRLVIIFLVEFPKIELLICENFVPNLDHSMTETLIKTYYLIYHMILQMWESEPIKVVLGVEILIFWIFLIGWGFASWRLKVKESRLGKT